MEYFILFVATLIAASLTFLSGFGLGTILLPVFILFFPPETAVAATAVVHLANNIFKALLMGHRADFSILKRFAIPAGIFAVLGSLALSYFADFPSLYTYSLGGHAFSISPIKLITGILIGVFALVEILPFIQNIAFDPKYVPLGGALSGFFGGLTGHQGAFRSAFLIRLGMEKEAFLGTTILTAIIVDLSRLLIYGLTFFAKDLSLLAEKGEGGIIIAGVLGALGGAIGGFYLVKKVTISFIQRFIAVLLMGYSAGLMAGLI